MSNNNTPKILLRLFYDGNDRKGQPWKVQEKGLLFWSTVRHCRSEGQAKSEMMSIADTVVRRKTGVVSEYTEEDYLADKLKSNVKREQESDVQTETASGMAYAAKNSASSQLKQLVGLSGPLV
jgi:hypothetical protein